MSVFDKIPLESFHRHKDMYLKTLRTFMLKHEYLEYHTVCIYKICSKITKSKITDVLFRNKRLEGCILILGIKKHLLVVYNELSIDIIHKLLVHV